MVLCSGDFAVACEDEGDCYWGFVELDLGMSPPFSYITERSANWGQNFFVVMITPVIINRLQWKAYLIFMCTNFAFVPLIYFFYPETAKMTLEEIDYLFTNPDKGPIQLSKDIAKERRKHGRVSVVGIVRGEAKGETEEDMKSGTGEGHIEKV